MEQLIVINVNPEKMKDYHRGDVCDMDFGYDGKVERHKVRIVSKYRLRNGESRVKLVSFQQSVQADTSLGYDIPEGYDAICGFCHYPFTFHNAKLSAIDWNQYCCRSCEIGITEPARATNAPRWAASPERKSCSIIGFSM